jgi:hypothetical protein
LLLACKAGVLPASEKVLELRWEQLGPVIEEHRVQVTLDDGRKLEGKVSIVLADDFILRTGNAVERVARSSIVNLRLADPGKKWRWIGAVIGFYSVAVPIAAGSKYGPEALQGSPILAACVGGISGYFAGRSADRRFREIRILPRVHLSNPGDSPLRADFMHARDAAPRR